MAAEEFKHRAEGWLAWTQIVAIVVAAVWTLYQWNRTIFPREDHDQRVRAAQSRTDVTIVDPRLTLGRLHIPGQADPGLPLNLPGEGSGAATTVLSGTYPTLVRAAMELQNDRSFPVEVTVSRLELATALVPAGGADLTWDKSRDLTPAEFFGPGLDRPRILESGGTMTLSGQQLTSFSWCCPFGQSPEIRLAHLDVELSLRGLDPETSEPVPAATKTRILQLRSFFYRDLSVFDLPVFAEALQSGQVAGRIEDGEGGAGDARDFLLPEELMSPL